MAFEVAKFIPMRSRRSFLRGVATVSALGTTTGLALGSVDAMSSSPLPYSLDWFLPHVGTPFFIETNHGTLTLELVAADPLPRHERIEAEKFSLVFRGPRTLQLTQQSCRLNHAQLGTMNLFLVPIVARSKEHFAYEAVFNSERKT